MLFLVLGTFLAAARTTELYSVHAQHPLLSANPDYTEGAMPKHNIYCFYSDKNTVPSITDAQRMSRDAAFFFFFFGFVVVPHCRPGVYFKKSIINKISVMKHCPRTCVHVNPVAPQQQPPHSAAGTGALSSRSPPPRASSAPRPTGLYLHSAHVQLCYPRVKEWERVGEEGGGGLLRSCPPPPPPPLLPFLLEKRNCVMEKKKRFLEVPSAKNAHVFARVKHLVSLIEQKIIIIIYYCDCYSACTTCCPPRTIKGSEVLLLPCTPAESAQLCLDMAGCTFHSSLDSYGGQGTMNEAKCSSVTRTGPGAAADWRLVQGAPQLHAETGSQ